MKQTYLILDYETRSEADLEEVGAWEYARHPTTEIICAAWRLGTIDTIRTAPIHSWCPMLDPWGNTNRDLANLAYKLADPRIVNVAHNAFFEQCITRFVLPKYLREIRFKNNPPKIENLPHSKWECTAARARALALPGKLEKACEALKLPVQKDMEGRRLILKYCKPRKATKHNIDKWHQEPEDFKRLVEYCKTDVAAETELFLATPPLIPFEKRVWELDQKINARGFAVDRDLVLKILDLIELETEALDDEMAALTNGDVRSAKQRDATLRALKKIGLNLPNLQAKTVRDTLSGPGLNDLARRLLTIRADASKSSTAKYAAFAARSKSDGRVRDILTYHAASTGRWGGSGVNPQNFPRGTMKFETLLDIIDGLSESLPNAK